MADHSLLLEPAVAARLAPHLDVAGKVVRAIEALGPVADRDVVLVDGGGGRIVAELVRLGARVTVVEQNAASLGVPDASADVIVGCWSAYRGIDPAEQAEADRVLRPDGRLLVLHDYGRDDVSRLADPNLPEYATWSRRDGPFLRAGFRVRVVHAWWTFDTVEQAAELLSEAFGERGTSLSVELRRPRLSWNLAVYHRDRGGA